MTAMELRPVLSLRHFGVSFGSKVVLAEVDLDVPSRGGAAI
jgi:hypothetical protein